MSSIDPDDQHRFPEWMLKADEIEATCLSVAAAGLACRLGMVDRELVEKSREALARRARAEAAAVVASSEG